MKSYVYVSLLASALVTTSGFAQNCLWYDSYVSEQKTVGVGECKLSKKLSLKRNGRIAYWEGSYNKPLMIEESTVNLITNVCTGQIEKRETLTTLRKVYVSFEIKNPNLRDDIPSYEQAPMTDEEAKEALATELRICEEFDGKE